MAPSFWNHEMSRLWGFFDPMDYQCLPTVSYSTLINGSPIGFVKPTRGIRQGDPLSSFLFTLVTGTLSRLFQCEEALGNIWGIKINKHCPSFTHLRFTDNLLVFVEVDGRNLQNIFQLLKTYQDWFGQKINKSKSSIFFSANMPNQQEENLHHFRSLKWHSKLQIPRDPSSHPQSQDKFFSISFG